MRCNAVRQVPAYVPWPRAHGTRLLGLRTTGAPAHGPRSTAARAAGRSGTADRRGTCARRLDQRRARGERLHAVGPAKSGPWALACPTDMECDTAEPVQVEGDDIRDRLPAGRDGAKIRKLTNELQMLLHEHPINIRRAARGLAPVRIRSGCGVSDGRANPRPGRCPRCAAMTPGCNGLRRLHGAEARPLAAAPGALATGAHSPDRSCGCGCWILPRNSTAGKSELCAPLVAALRKGTNPRGERAAGRCAVHDFACRSLCRVASSPSVAGAADMRERRILRRIVSPTALESLSTGPHPVLRRV